MGLGGKVLSNQSKIANAEKVIAKRDRLRYLVLIMVDIQTISIVLASAGVIAGVIYYILDLQHQKKIRQTDLVVRLYSAFSGKELQEAYFETVYGFEFADYDDFMKKYRMPTKSILPLWQVCKFFDGVGVLLRRKLVDIGLVDELFHAEATIVWEKVKPLVEGRRKALNQPTTYQCFEYLYNEMKKREQQK